MATQFLTSAELKFLTCANIVILVLIKVWLALEQPFSLSLVFLQGCFRTRKLLLRWYATRFCVIGSFYRRWSFLACCLEHLQQTLPRKPTYCPISPKSTQPHPRTHRVAAGSQSRVTVSREYVKDQVSLACGSRHMLLYVYYWAVNSPISALNPGCCAAAALLQILRIG